ncbi:MAG: hypothetical protein KGY66_01465 [Candidatus Thermoplasmatota archaeon]|nr:hypothetical protein [Candidatus Thermoplasmatota archaeon]MBS3789566.1 hypothetical protein [Candidatus Thermoplasmatota archaeon]
MAVNDQTESGRNILSLFYALLAGSGLAFYFSWSFLYGTWTDIGVYAVSVVLIAFGIVGYLLYSIEE